MKLNKTMGRVATTLVATAMLASVAVVPAFATEPTQSNMTSGAIDGSIAEPVTELVFQKDLVKPAGVATPNVTFTFDLAGATSVTDSDKVTEGDRTITVVPGSNHGTLSNVEAIFDSNSVQTGSNNEDPENATVTVSEYVTLNLTEANGFTFSEPGIYKYTLSEDTVSDTNYTTSASYTVYLYVERDEDAENQPCVITGATMFSGVSEDATGSKTDTMTNFYLVKDGQVVANSLTVDKVVTGEMGDKSNEFNFTITINANGDATNRNYTASNATVTNNEDGTYTVVGSLHDGEALTINGLVDGDTYSINETAADQDGYDTSVAAKSGMNNTTVTNSDGTNTLKNASTVTFNAEDGADAVTYTNTRNAVSPTGIVMNVAPYALLVVVAAAGCFVFMRKRRED